ncbi:hypothetical protein [Limnoglobus roseus]|uniref:Uncharacterized protein n=1 Tax=Limnoglobus roseus TaxID=2598579 RepID=A0A5C1AP23_9BACT|nr:hypothetical protein [Limnoglobus roseus]QEL19907.1 hypothetical protein PX52LOC_06989 [Limnoglobus roseus]
MAGKNGRPKTTFTQEDRDLAKELLGRLMYAGRVAGRLQEQLKVSRDVAHRLIDEARAEVVRGFQESGTANDPLAALAMFFVQVMSNEDVSYQVRVQAANGLTKLLAVDRVSSLLGGGDVEAFLTGLKGRQDAREPKSQPEGSTS